MRALAEHIEITEEMRALLGQPDEPWPYEVTTTGVRAFARGVGYDDPVFFDSQAAQKRGYANLPAPPCYLGTPAYVPGAVDDTFSVPPRVSPRPGFGLSNVLDASTEATYERPLIAGETLSVTRTLSDLTVKESKAIGAMLLVTVDSEFRDASGQVVARERSQVFWY